MTNVVQVLIGTYELIAFLNLSGQLSRRSTVIHFRDTTLRMPRTSDFSVLSSSPSNGYAF
jgi:hypothetical protein